MRLLLLDLKNCGPKSRLTAKGNNRAHIIPATYQHFPDAAQALLALKTLGKVPKGSLYLSSAANLSSLLALSSAFKDDPEASSEALRVIANALLLIDEARTTFVRKDVVGGTATAVMLEVSLINYLYQLALPLALSESKYPRSNIHLITYIVSLYSFDHPFCPDAGRRKASWSYDCRHHQF